ncbi:hypothetical protein Lesp02_36120 [Lentzea sp. NBRC 105346]|uniref:glycosyltransferase 87 family protein n=1 Tax=Lentzea sp. NBRC 105346 TaxID=3032205 RepID=UPI0024A1B8C3|nr:glycosyltransferase 87 family protein [Lentzea sp. NBRC 105346]GLZ31424.1 hypothetical protein Lesp02_36120 [Lentzea sp. NBRC 105346]
MSNNARAGQLLLDLGMYLGFAVFARATSLWSEFYGYRVWGDFAFVAYVLAAVHALVLLLWSQWLPARLRSRTLPIWLVVVVGFAAPLAKLVVTRLGAPDWTNTPWTWSAQPNVWVIERSAQLLLANGTPYIDVTALGRTPDVNDYTPYGPLMPVFGLPRALFGTSPLTDARIMFAITAVVAVAVSLRVLGRPRVPVRAAQLAVAGPLTLLTATVSGEDLAVIALLGLAAALVLREKPGWAGAVVAMAVSIKLIALPGAVVLTVLVLGRRRYFGAFAGVFALVNVPVLLVDPGAFVEHAIRFPAGAAHVRSPAASPFPGHLLTELGPSGHAAALALLVAGGVANLLWLLLRRPETVADVMKRIVVGMSTAILLMPASRFGYLVYPVVFLGAMLFFAAVERKRVPTFQPVLSG